MPITVQKLRLAEKLGLARLLAWIPRPVLKWTLNILTLITIIDLFIPDPLFAIDEAVLLALTGLLATAYKITSPGQEPKSH